MLIKLEFAKIRTKIPDHINKITLILSFLVILITDVLMVILFIELIEATFS